MPLGHRARDPALEERTADAIAGLKSRDAGTDGGDFARAVGERNQVAVYRTAKIVAGDHHLIAVIQRCGADADENFARSWLRVGAFGGAQTIQGGRALLNFVNFHYYDFTAFTRALNVTTKQADEGVGCGPGGPPHKVVLAPQYRLEQVERSAMGRSRRGALVGRCAYWLLL